MIQLDQFAPDLDPTIPGIITECSNMVPILAGYGSAPEGADVGMDTLAADALSGIYTYQLDGTARLLIGAVTKLYEKSVLSWADVSRHTSATVTMTIASPGVVSWTNHGLLATTAIVFTTTGALPTGVTPGTTYYVIAAGLAANAFQFSTSSGGSAVNTSGSQSGVHTATRTGSAYTATTTNPWRYSQFGNVALAVNKADVIQASTTGVFSDLLSPKASYMCVVSGFVMVANTNDATYGDTVDRWWCSAYLVHTDWVPAISTQCTTGRLVDSPGAITGMKALGYDVVAYKDRSMYLGRYSGPPGVWDFTLLPGYAGCSSQEAIADIGTAHIFIGEDDIYVFDGSMPRPVGTPIREWFFNDMDGGRKHTITHSHDRFNYLVYFFYPRLNDAVKLTGCIVYNYKTNKWGLANKSIQCAIEYGLGGYTWDTIPAATWADWPKVAYYSRYWTPTRYASYIGADKKLYALTAGSNASSITTGDMGTESKYSLLSRVTLRYLDVPATATMTNYYLEYHGGQWTTDQTTTESSGRFDVFRSAPWHKAKFDFTSVVEITGIAVEIQMDGVL